MEKYLIEKKQGYPQVFKTNKIEEFIELVTWISMDGHLVYRGQRSDLPLIPSIGRDKEKSRWFYREKEVLEEFKRESFPYLSILPSNDWQWLAVAQHNRLPTRFLDWTKSPLIALWFAVSKPANDGKCGVVWSFNYEPSETINFSNDMSSPFSIDKTYLYFPEHVFNYIQAQSGAFTIHHRNSETNDFVPFETTKDAEYLLKKILIPSDQFRFVRHGLFRLGITPSSLFPGLYGLVERIKYENVLREDER